MLTVVIGIGLVVVASMSVTSINQLEKRIDVLQDINELLHAKNGMYERQLAKKDDDSE